MQNVVPLREQRAFFSRTTPVALQQILDSALVETRTDIKESTLLQARMVWPEEPDTHISLYKFYFVSGEYNKAEAAVWYAMKMAAQMLGISKNYRRLTGSSADWSKRAGPERLYLFSLKALGVCRLRRGRVLAAHTVLHRLSLLDPNDEIGGHAFLGIAASFFDAED